MINSNDFITKRSDSSQVVEYNNPQFECFATNPYYSSDKNYYVTEHWHEDLEYLYVIEGELEYIVNGKTILLHAKEGILVNSRRIHSNHSVPGKSCAFYCAIIHPTLLCSTKYIEQTYLNPVMAPDSFDYLLLTENDWTHLIIDELLRLFETPDQENIELEILESSMRILKTVYSHLEKVNHPVSPISANVGVFKSMLLYIQEHYMEKVSLDDIAAAGNIGKTLCAKLFKKYVSKTPGEYLIYYRIQKSIHLLTTTNRSTTDIAYAVGFSSASHYTKTFREIVGCTPLKYRTNNSKQEHTYCLIPQSDFK